MVVARVVLRCRRAEDLIDHAPNLPRWRCRRAHRILRIRRQAPVDGGGRHHSEDPQATRGTVGEPGLSGCPFVLLTPLSDERVVQMLPAVSERLACSALLQSPNDAVVVRRSATAESSQERLPPRPKGVTADIPRRQGLHFVRQVVRLERHVLAQVSAERFGRISSLASEKNFAKTLEILFLESCPFHSSPSARLSPRGKKRV